MKKTSWLERIEEARRPFREWENLTKHLVRKFRALTSGGDIRSYVDGPEAGGRGDGGARATAARFNVLFANVEAMQPALFTRAPSAVASRRHRDRDAIGRVAAEVLTRAAQSEIEENGLAEVMEQVVLDLLLPGRGVPWIRYEADKQKDGTTSNQRTMVDHVHVLDFVHSPARTWAEVVRNGWVARRVTMTRQEGVERFGDTFANVALTLQSRGSRPDTDHRMQGAEPEYAEVWEVWDRKSRQQIFVAEGVKGGPGGKGGGYRQEGILEERDDPYQLRSFFPCPKPVYSTLSNDDLVPTPDYEQYRDQAEELDRISARIQRLVASLKLVGAYDNSAEGLGRLLTAEDGTLVPVVGLGKMAGGMDQVIRFMPVKEIAEVLVSLYEARNQAKAVLDELSGVADIVRGQGDPTEKATTAKIKSGFVTSRLDRRKRKIEHCARDVIRLMVEMQIELFPEDRLRQQSGFDFIDEVQEIAYEHQQQVEDYQRRMQEFQQAAEAAAMAGPQLGPGAGVGSPEGAPAPQESPAPGQPPPQPAAAAGGPPQAAPSPGVETGGEPQPQQPEQPQMPPHPGPPPPQESPVEKLWQKIIELLKNERLRGFRLDVESGSTVEISDTLSKTERVEFATAMGEYLSKVIEVMERSPDLAPVVLDILSFTARTYKVGRSIESDIEEAVQKIRMRAQQLEQQEAEGGGEEAAPEEPPDPRPAVDAARTQQATQIDATKAEADAAKAQAEIEGTKAKTQLTQAQIEREAQKADIEAAEATKRLSQPAPAPGAGE